MLEIPRRACPTPHRSTPSAVEWSSHAPLRWLFRGARRIRPKFSLTSILTFGQLWEARSRMDWVSGLDGWMCRRLEADTYSERFSRSASYAKFCTVPKSDIQLNVAKHFRFFSSIFKTCRSCLPLFIGVQKSSISMKNGRKFNNFEIWQKNIKIN